MEREKQKKSKNEKDNRKMNNNNKNKVCYDHNQKNLCFLQVFYLISKPNKIIENKE